MLFFHLIDSGLLLLHYLRQLDLELLRSFQLILVGRLLTATYFVFDRACSLSPDNSLILVSRGAHRRHILVN